MFEPYLKGFFVHSSDPTHIRLLKVTILFTNDRCNFLLSVNGYNAVYVLWFNFILGSKLSFHLSLGMVKYDHNELESNGIKIEPHKSYAVEMHLSQLLKTNQ